MFTTVEQDTNLKQTIHLQLRPTILILDSGVGGLSIYHEIQKLLPNLRYIYVFDNKNFPYGKKKKIQIVNYVTKIVKAITNEFALSLAIIACNSASTVSLPNLRKYFKFPIVGVVPAIKPATFLTRNGIIGLLATNSTIKSDYTNQLIVQFASKFKIELLDSTKLVELAETKLHGKKIIISDVQQIIEPWLYMNSQPDTIVLGCTHFPLLYNELKSVFLYGTHFVDSGKAVANRIAWLLRYQAPLRLSSGQNLAFCTLMDDAAMQLSFTLKYYGFPILKKLEI